MASTTSAERKASLPDLSSELSNGSSALFHRRIEFHPARRPYRGFVNRGGDFRIETLNPSSDSGRSLIGSGQNGFSAKKSDVSEVLESGLDPELSFGITFKSIGAGLENMGNTCYLNSVLQCLTYTEPLAAYLQSGKHKNSCRIAGFCALCAIQKHVSRALQSTGRCLSPHEIVANLKCISRNFRSWRQEDAHEYMVNLLESMHKCCLPSGVPSESPGAYEKSLVHKIFGGSLRSQVKCMQCSFGSNKYDPFLDLSLEINKADSLEKALSNFTTSELLDGGEKEYQCQRCKQKVRARKQLTVHKPPYVLTIHLKRFRAHDPSQKIDKKVNFSPTLDLRPFVSDPQGGNVKYTLYGVLVHSGGSTRSGHYYCFVRTSSGIWHSLDDNRVSPVSEKRVLEQKAYMLFYVHDRGNIISRKLMDIPKKENLKANEPVTMNSSAQNQILRKQVQNGPSDVKVNGIASSAVVAQKDVPSAVPPTIPFSKEGLNNQPKSEQTTTPSQPKDPSETASLPPKTPGQDLKLAPASNNNGVCKLDNSTSTAANTNELDAKGSSGKNSCVSVLTSINLKEIQISAPAKDTKIESLQVNNSASHVEGSSMDSSNDPIRSSVEKIDSIKQPDQPSCEQSQVGNTTHVAIGDISLLKKTGECSRNSAVEKSALIPDSSSIPSRSTHLEASDYKSPKKMKKQVLRRQVASSSFHSSFFLRVSLAIQKRKKHNRSKSRSPSGSKNLSKELQVDNNSLSDFGPSTSEKTSMISRSASHSQRNETKSALTVETKCTPSEDKNYSDGGSLKSIIVNDGEFEKRIGEYDTELARVDRLPTHTSLRSSMSQMNGMNTEGHVDYKRDKMQNGMLAQGLGDTIVARWDDVELPPVNIESGAVQSVSIGYIGDEWDEEYDRGKRKKVRLAKYDFGGQNPFQEIASNKAKKAKIDRSISGNQPFRI